jgi:hypothetical protein
MRKKLIPSPHLVRLRIGTGGAGWLFFQLQTSPSDRLHLSHHLSMCLIGDTILSTLSLASVVRLPSRAFVIASKAIAVEHASHSDTRLPRSSRVHRERYRFTFEEAVMLSDQTILLIGMPLYCVESDGLHCISSPTSPRQHVPLISIRSMDYLCNTMPGHSSSSAG